MPPVKPRACAELSVAEIDGEAVVWDPVPERLHYLNHSAALVFALCDGQTTIAQIADAIADVYEMDPRELSSQITPMVEQFREAGLVEGKVSDQIAVDAGERRALLAGLQRIPVPQDT